MKKKFSAKINKLLKLTTHSIYSDKKLAIRELLSNASDACNKLRIQELQNNDQDVTNFQINISIDKDSKILSIEDNGIGMTISEMEENLGTIAQSGTEEFGEGSDKSKDLIGQFGVGFYSSFMISSDVTVISKKDGKVSKWHTTDYEAFDIDTIDEDPFNGKSGTIVKMVINDDEMLEKMTISNIVEKNSSNIAFPIYIKDASQEDFEKIESDQSIWRERKLDAKKRNEFYKKNFHSMSDPVWSMHTNIEGDVEYSALLFAPHEDAAVRYYASRDKSIIKLYSKGILIQDGFEGMLPPFLRFIEGIVDCYDIDLNISREILQRSRKIEKVKESIVKKVMTSMARSKSFESIKMHYGQILKEGICDYKHQQKVLDIMTFQSVIHDEPITLSKYIEEMGDDHKEIYYACGRHYDALASSPQVRSLKEKGKNVIILTDNIDSIWVGMVQQYNEKHFKSVLSLEDEETPEDLKALIEKIKSKLPAKIKDVKISSHLMDIPAFTSQINQSNPLASMMMTQKEEETFNLEINPDHVIITNLAKLLDKEGIDKEIETLIETLILCGMLRADTKWNAEEIQLISALENMLESQIEFQSKL